jgi:hypothetical protein
MNGLAITFNRSRFSRFLNSPAGRVFRIVAGLGFLIVGLVFKDHLFGVLSLVWSFFPLSAGALDICYISALLGGPIAGKVIRTRYQSV